MKQTNFRDVPDDLWETIEPLLAPCLAEVFSEPAHTLLLLHRQFYGTTLSGLGLHPWEKPTISKFILGVL